MTGQIADTFLLDGVEYALVGINGEGLFDPADFDLRPYSSCTACWRGFVLTYDIRENILLLSKLHINLKEAKVVNGVEPSTEKDEYSFFDYVYHLNMRVPFTGTLMLGKDMISGMYVHMGFQRAMAFETVFELELKDGVVIRKRDLSKKMKERRESDPTEGARPKEAQDPREWIAETFSQEYDSDE